MIPPVVPGPCHSSAIPLPAARILCVNRDAAHLIWKNALKLNLFCDGEMTNNKYTAIVF
jgi:hypothetical protein